jgi:hypothetical protein
MSAFRPIAAMVAFALVVGAGMAFEGLLIGGFPMGLVGVHGGPALGASLGLGLTLRAPRVFPAGVAGRLTAWGLALLLLASPYLLLSFGGLPPWTPARLVATAVLAATCFLQCARVGSFWPAIVLPLWPALTMSAMSFCEPCWQSSNAAWCGHACDAPPSADCP